MHSLNLIRPEKLSRAEARGTVILIFRGVRYHWIRLEGVCTIKPGTVVYTHTTSFEETDFKGCALLADLKWCSLLLGGF